MGSSSTCHCLNVVQRTTNGDSALVVERLGKRFGDRVAFDDVSFEAGIAVPSRARISVKREHA
jgi:hypothetical protein